MVKKIISNIELSKLLLGLWLGEIVGLGRREDSSGESCYSEVELFLPNSTPILIFSKISPVCASTLYS